jgi:hypothetical protein
MPTKPAIFITRLDSSLVTKTTAYPPIKIIGRLSLLCDAISLAELCPPSAAFFSFTAPLSLATIASSESPAVAEKCHIKSSGQQLVLHN